MKKNEQRAILQLGSLGNGKIPASKLSRIFYIILIIEMPTDYFNGLIVSTGLKSSANVLWFL